MTKYKIRKNFLICAILVTGLISMLIALVAYFGLNMGTFVISLGDLAYETGIGLSTDPEFKTSYPKLVVTPKNDVWPITYADLDLEKIVEGEGDYQDPNGLTYLAYNFYLKNEGNTTVDLIFNIKITEVTLNLDQCLRVILIEDKTNEYIFLKDDGGEKHEFEKTPEEKSYYFKSDDMICQRPLENFKPNEIKKYTVILYLEGWDEQCTDAAQGGQIRMEMNFSITSAKTDDN